MQFVGGNDLEQHFGWLSQEMLLELLPRVLPACMAGLEDADDDVRAVAAEALTPAAAAIVASAESKHVTTILLSLWDILLDLDDLSPSTSRCVSIFPCFIPYTCFLLRYLS